MKNENTILVVLSPGRPDEHQNFHNQPKTIKRYVGGKIRMEAAAKLAKEYKTIMVIGGSEDKIGSMKLYLSKSGINPNKIIRIESNPNTNGNLRALKIATKTYKELKTKTYHILSNKYHLKRIETMAKDNLKGLKWKTIPAEDYIKGTKEVEEKYKENFKLRKALEKQGVEDWKNKRYKEQEKPIKEFKSIIRDRELI